MLARAPLPVPASNRPDFRHVDSWIFDLDNTLYEPGSALLAIVEKRICAFVQRHCGLAEDEAFRLQKAYYRQYGNTLAGLMAHHGTAPEDYLSFVNDVDVSSLPIDSRLEAAMARLPGRRFVFTNNCGNYAERVLKHLGLSELINDIWDIRAIGFAPKPDPAAYSAVIAHGEFEPKRAAFFEDLSGNLEPAHELGMTTVCVGAIPELRLPHIHHYTDDMPCFLEHIEVSS